MLARCDLGFFFSCPTPLLYIYIYQGAVSMATLPKEPVLPEAAFIGRSNVGKSSLINMVCNRKVRW